MEQHILVWCGDLRAPVIHHLARSLPNIRLVGWGAPKRQDARDAAERYQIPCGDDLRAMTAELRPDWILLCEETGCEETALASAMNDNARVLAWAAPARTLRDLRTIKPHRIDMVPAIRDVPGIIHAAEPEQVLERLQQMSITSAGPAQHMDAFSRIWMCFTAMMPHLLHRPELVAATSPQATDYEAIQVLAWTPGGIGLHVHVALSGPERFALSWQGEKGVLQSNSHGYGLWHKDGSLIDEKQAPMSMSDTDWLDMMTRAVQKRLSEPATDESYMETAMACTQAAWMALKSGYPVETDHIMNMAGRL